MTPQSASVLVVDDVAENRDILVRRLKRLGIGSIEEAATGRAALDALSRRSFDLMLLDIMMPEMNGFEVLEHLKARGALAELPVIVISALSEIEPVVRCIELGADDFVLKPVNATLLRARVLATLEKKALRDQIRDELCRKQAELADARTLQLALVPPAFRGVLRGRALDIDVVLEPAKEVGGDLVDYFALGDGRLVFVLGDVSDKGASAALTMARTNAVLRSLASQPDAVALFRSPARVMDRANATLSAGNAACMFVTLFLAALDVASGRLAYVRAGQVPPFLRRADGSVERLAAAGGPPLGLAPDAAYTAATIDLRPGDELLVTTDGFTEAANPSGVLFGDASIEALLAGPTQPGLIGRLTGMVRDFEGGQAPSDDAAALHLKFGGASE